MKNVFKNVDWKKVGTFAGGFVKFWQVMMQRKYTHSAQQQFFVQKSV